VMHIIAGTLSFAAEERDDVIASLVEITELSKNDPGCVEYWWAEDIERSNTFRFFECWATREQFDAHVAAPHEKAFGERNLARITGAAATMYEATPTQA
ncbi:MAG: putative quinol monooxygenase, partial [Acidimicrobiales bacterium]